MFFQTKFILRALAFLSLSLLITSCFLVKSSDIIIGEFSSMTGPEASFGISGGHGIQMAIDEVNSSGGINGRKIQLVHRDTESSRDKTIEVVTKLIRQDKVLALIGEIASERSLAAAPLAQSAGIPMISPASTNPNVTEVGHFIFRSCYIDPFQGFAMAKFAAKDLKFKRVAIFRNDRSNYSTGLAEYFKETFEKMGGVIVAEESYTTEDSDYKSSLARIKTARPEAIFVPGYFAEVRTIAEQIKKLRLKAVLLGGDGWDSQDLINDSLGNLDGAYYTNHFTSEDKNPKAVEFVLKYKDLHGVLPDGVAAMGYDAARILIEALKTAKDLSSIEIRNTLALTKNHDGVTGKITFNEDRDPVKPIVVLKINGRKAQFVKRIEP